MKRILLALMLGIGVLGFAQSEEEIVQKYIVDKIKGYKFTNLVPYSKNPYRFCDENTKHF